MRFHRKKTEPINDGIYKFLNGLLATSSLMEGKTAICNICSAVRQSAWEPCHRCGDID